MALMMLKSTFILQYLQRVNRGAKLPPTAQEVLKKKTKQQQGQMQKFIQTPKFDQKTLNQILVMWLVRNSLPWTCIEDMILYVAFNYVRQGIKLNSQVWAYTKAHKLYFNLQSKVFSMLGNLESKITLIHDVWTTKGTRHAFMGISAAYVTNDWNFKITHLGLKFIAWMQYKGKYLATTDSGSNNSTMALEVDHLILNKTGIHLDLANRHIKCFCHKLALIVKSGLVAISVGTKGLIKSKKETLGFVPGLATVLEESHEIDESNTFPEEHAFNEDDDVVTALSDDNSSEQEEPSPNQSNSQESGNKVALVMKKVDLVIQKITSSAAKQSEFKTWAKKLDYSGPTLIAGYGIRWNIKFQSRDHGYQARNVINRLIENERDQQEKEGGKNYFDDTKISCNNWEMVKRLNDILGEFYIFTKKMEGDFSSASMMIAEYRTIKTYLAEKKSSATEPKYREMFTKMIEKTDKYLNEALKDELTIYFGGKYKWTSAQASQSLSWWKVRGLIAARPKGVRTPIRTPKKNVVQPLHTASGRRAEAARPSLQAARHFHAFNRRATLPDRHAEPARLSGGRAKPARPLDRRAGFARLSAHVSLSIREAYVSHAIGATAYVALIMRLTNPPPSSTTQIRKQMTGHARQTLTRPNHQVPAELAWAGSRKPLDLRGLREPRNWSYVRRSTDCVAHALHALQTGVQALHACLAGSHAICTPIEGVQPAGKGVQPLHLGVRIGVCTPFGRAAIKPRKEHGQEFPVLSLLARDYLSCCATSASVERCFSAAADTCGQDCGSLAAQTIERCVSSNQWLVQGVNPNGEFEAAHGIIKQVMADKELESNKHIPDMV
ncbi:hypothetical protein PCANC_06883 [Puccinia coronata f. sp. avenae]|uniref:HAT C-terminal dimerisation domain-containing protein n=1 Tax=Puccinia coronata f. sp. avenae TaxID=200324 RepID=A0A2N5VGS9_9BASI|nr:hypothetical protein PCANC_06883 [Puccinia coronata f. sp. avenae]